MTTVIHIGKAQSETLSESEKSLGEKYRDNQKSLLSDTHWSKGATSYQSSSLATPVSMDLRVDKSQVPFPSPVKQASRHGSPVDLAPVN